MPMRGSYVSFLSTNMNEKATMYEHCKALGVPIENHESDLYVPVTEETTRLVASFPFREQVRTFRHNVHETLWYEIPFSYDPYWAHKRSFRIET